MNWKQHYWVLFIFILSGASLAGEIANHKFYTLDFEVYYRTAMRMLNHAEIYSVAQDGHYVYKYSPVAGLFFIPFAFLEYTVASVIYWALLTFLLIVGLKKFFNLLNESYSQCKKNSISLVLILSLLTVGVHVHREWHLGQVNMLLLVMYIFLILTYSRNQTKLFSALLSMSVFLKPFALIFIPYLIYRQKWRMIGYFLLFTIGLVFTPLFFYPSIEQLTNLYQSWQNELLIEINSKQNLFANANHTIFSVIARFTPLKYILTTTISQKIYQLILLVFIGICFLAFSLKQKKREATIKEFAFLIGLIPLLAFTSENAFIFELPLIIILMYHFKSLSTLLRTVYVISCLMIGINIYDLVGNVVSTFLLMISIYTVGTVLLFICIFFEPEFQEV